MAMSAAQAADVINGVVYKPGWLIQATPWTERHQDAVKVHFEYPAYNSSQPPYFPEAITARADFGLLAGDCPDSTVLLAKLLGLILMVEEHEAREFLRIGPDHDAPFHPHRRDGIARWASGAHRHAIPTHEQLMVSRDLLFGAV